MFEIYIKYILVPQLAPTRKNQKEAVEDELPGSEEEPGEDEDALDETGQGDRDMAAQVPTVSPEKTEQTHPEPKKRAYRKKTPVTDPVVAPKAKAKAQAKAKAKAQGKAKAKAKGKAKAKAKAAGSKKNTEPSDPAPSNPKRKQRKTGDPPLPVPLEKRDELKKFLAWDLLMLLFPFSPTRSFLFTSSMFFHICLAI